MLAETSKARMTVPSGSRQVHRRLRPGEGDHEDREPDHEQDRAGSGARMPSRRRTVAWPRPPRIMARPRRVVDRPVHQDAERHERHGEQHAPAR